jgi:phytoene dehydrogenase-like protein
MKTKKFDSIIVGGGIAGLTAAAYVSRKGKKTLLIEKNKEFGGLVNSFKVDGFLFEGGVRALESAGIILPMLEDLGIELETVRSKVSVGIENEIIHAENLSSVDSYKNMLTRIYPESEDEIKNFISQMLRIMKKLDVLYGIDNPIFKDLKNDKDFLFKKLLPWLPKFLFTVGKINRLNTPVEEYLEKNIKNDSLRDIISQHFFKGTPAFFALSYFSLYLDYFYPKGGVGKLAEVIKDKIEEYGADLLSNTSIVRIEPVEKRVFDSEGRSYEYDNLIWAADLKTFYRITNTAKLPSKIQSEFIFQKSKIDKCKGSESVFTLYLEVDLNIAHFENIANGHFFYTPSRKGLNSIHRNELRSLLGNWRKHKEDDIINWFNSFLEYNTFEISIPGIKDKALVPEGKSGIIISFIIEHELFAKIQQSGWYDSIKTHIENKLIEILTQSIYPKLKSHIIKQFSFTPINMQSRIASTDGAIVGWSFEDQVPVINKIQRAAKAVQTPIPNIYQAGQWAYSPAGVPMSILTGKLAADKIVKAD